MAGKRPKRRFSIARYGSAAVGVEVAIPATAVEVSVRAVDGTGVPVAWTLAKSADPGKVLHFTAGESWTPDDLALAAPLVLLVVSAAGGFVEVGLWQRDVTRAGVTSAPSGSPAVSANEAVNVPSLEGADDAQPESS